MEGGTVPVEVPTTMNRALAASIAVLAVAALAASVFTVSYPFLYDDHLYVATNPQVHDLASVVTSFGTAYPANAPELGLYRPVTVASYALNRALLGPGPGGFHLVNSLLHVAATLAFFFVARRLLAGRLLPAFAAALLFAVHAVHTEAVTWIVGRAEVLATLFALLAFRCHVAWRETGAGVSLGLLAISAAAALFSKETAVAIGALVFAYDAIARGEGLFRGFRRRLPSYAVLGLVLAAYLGARYAALGRLDPVPSQQVSAGMPAVSVAALMARVFASYARLLLVPVDLQVDYAIGAADRPGAVAVLLSLLSLAALALLFARIRKASPAAAFGAAWAALALLPVSHLVPMGAFIAERFLYLSSAGAALVLGIAGARLLETGGERRVYVLSLVPFALLLLTLLRNRDWSEEERFYAAAIRSNPKSYRSHVNLGNLYLDRRQYTAAEATFRAAADLAEKPLEALSNLAQVLSLQGKEKEAIETFRQAAKSDPESIPAALNLANALARAGESLEAEVVARGILSRAPRDAEARRLLALVLSETDRAAEAIPILEDLAAESPGDPRFAFDLGEAFRAAGRNPEAIEAYRRAIHADGGHLPSRLNSAALLIQVGSLESALDEYETILRLSPGHPAATAGLRACRKKIAERAAGAPPSGEPPAPAPRGDG